jgi:endo-beta-N-acetylglucosaminidase D
VFSTRFIQGSEVQNSYSFYHWQYIDIFVYFSHHTVTIPPVGWTNAAHRHGVCILGKSQAISTPAGEDQIVTISSNVGHWSLW